jgi:hypothetical protein
MTEEKIRENRLRRMAERQGLQLVKSRRRDSLAIGYGTYWLVGDEDGPYYVPSTVDIKTRRPTGYTMDEVEGYLIRGKLPDVLK